MRPLRSIRSAATWSRRVAALAVVAFVMATAAYAAHLHGHDDADADAGDGICALCLHFARIGTTPLPGIAPPPPVAIAGTAAPAAQPALPGAVPVAYRSRAPPA